MGKVQNAAVPTIADVTPDILTGLAPVGIVGPDGKVRIGKVQPGRLARFALVTYGPDVPTLDTDGTTERIHVGEESGTFGMYGTAGNGATGPDASVTPGCIGHGKDGTPVIGRGYLYGFVGTIPTGHGAIPVSGRWCESCTRAVRMDGTIIRNEPVLTDK